MPPSRELTSLPGVAAGTALTFAGRASPMPTPDSSASSRVVGAGRVSVHRGIRGPADREWRLESLLLRASSLSHPHFFAGSSPYFGAGRP